MCHLIQQHVKVKGLNEYKMRWSFWVPQPSFDPQYNFIQILQEGYCGNITLHD
jgi:hypothetical protein